MIRNIDNCQYSSKNGEYGGASGSKNGIVIDGENWLVKYPKNAKDLARHAEMLYTNDPVSEYIGSHIYAILNYPVHETMLVERNNKIAVACKDIEDQYQKRLVEIRTIKNAVNDTLEERLDRTFTSTGDAHGVGFSEILLHLKYNDILSSIKGIEDRFWDMLVIDIYINNSDRNNGNWGILRKEGEPDMLAPIYDNGGSFNGKTPDSRLEKMLMNKDIILNSSISGITTFLDNQGKNILSRDMLKLHNDNLYKSLIKNIPIIKASRNDIYKMIDGIPNEACSNVRKMFYKETLDLRLIHLLEPAYEKALLSLDKTTEIKDITDIPIDDRIKNAKERVAERRTQSGVIANRVADIDTR